MDWLRDAIVNQKVRAMSRQWRDVGAALADLLGDERTLAAIPPKAAWTMINGVRSGLREIETALRQARGYDLPVGARRATGDLLYALGDVRDVVESYVVPVAEKRYGFPPPGGR